MSEGGAANGDVELLSARAEESKSLRGEDDGRASDVESVENSKSKSRSGEGDGSNADAAENSKSKSRSAKEDTDGDADPAEESKSKLLSAKDNDSDANVAEKSKSKSKSRAAEGDDSDDDADADAAEEKRATSAENNGSEDSRTSSDGSHPAKDDDVAVPLTRQPSLASHHETSKDWEFFVQFTALMRRNLLIKRRRWLATLFEIALPVLAIVVTILIQGAIRDDSDPNRPQALHLLPCSAPLRCNDTHSALEWDRALQYQRLNFMLGISFEEIDLQTALAELPNITDEYDFLNPNQTIAMEEGVRLVTDFGFLGETERVVAVAPAGDIANEFEIFLESFNVIDYQFGAPILFPETNRVRIFDSEEAIDEYIVDVDYGREGADRPLIHFGVVFDSVDGDEVAYTIRAKATGDAENPPATAFTNGAFTLNNTVQFDSSSFNTYTGLGWSYMQEIVEIFLIRRAMENPEDFEINNVPFIFQPFPVPDSFSDTFAEVVGTLLGLLYTLFYLFAVTRIVKSIVEEKELRIRENMKIMGLQEQVLTVSWFCTYCIIFFIISIVTVAITATSLYEFSNKGYIFWFFFSFGLGVFAFSYLMSAFFTRARIAAVLSAIVFLLTFFPTFALDVEDSTNGQKLAGCLSLPICFGLGVSHIANFEATSIGVTASNVNTSFNNITFNAILGMMILDFFLYTFIGWYLEKVLPSKYGSHRPWYFLAQPSYWSKSVRDREAEKKRHESVEYQRLNESESPENSENFEPAGDDLKNNVGISVRALRKVFGTEGTAAAVTAVKGTNLEMFEGQILSLLGHNGAGKTTTINMLTGFYPPTSGDAFMLGSSLTTDMAAIRKKMGICPQHDVLYPILTVREHLDIYASIKGVKSNERKEAVQEMIDLIGLSDAGDRAAGALSGGMKRKLSVGMALIGDSKIIFLDEPTSGMDTYSRQQFWDLIKSQKEGRTIVLTTHYMDEADYLGDRIAIMGEGEVKCWGTSLFLKNRYGVGYTLAMSKRPKCDEERINALVLEGIKGATKMTNVATEISFRLPFNSSSQFPDLFESFDNDLDGIGIESYGISVTTLDEVFLRVANDDALDTESQELVRSLSKKASKRGMDDDQMNTEFAVAIREPRTEGERVWRHFTAMFIRRAIGAKRDLRVFVCMCLIPFIILLAGIGVVTLLSSFTFNAITISSREMFNTPNIVSFNAESPRGVSIMAAMFNDSRSGLYEGEPFARGDVTNSTRESMQLSLLNNLRFEQFPQPDWEGTTQYTALMFDVAQLANGSDVPDGRVYDALFFNTTARHGVVAVLNQYYNVLGRSLTGNPNFKTTVSNHPFPQTAEEQLFQNALAGIFVGIAFAFIPAIYVAHVVRDRSTQSKHQQMVSGASPTAYWLSIYAWDVVFYLLPMVSAIVVFAIYGVDEFIGAENIGAGFTLLLIYGISVGPFAYLCSFLFGDHTTAQSVMLFVGIIGGGILPLVWTLMNLIESTRDINASLVYIYLLFPPFAVAQGVSSLITRQAVFGGGASLDPFDFEVATRPLIYMVVEAFVYFALVLLIEKVQTTPKWLAYVNSMWVRATSLCSPQDSAVADNAPDPDEDVIAEAERVENDEDAQDEPIRMLGLRKEFGAKVAVDNLTFGVPSGQVFGFLGVNGAGKTTSLKMLTADILPTAGEAFLLGNDIATSQRSIRQSLGYCPQFDALIDKLTAREHLTMYCRIKLVEESTIEEYVEALIKRIGLTEWADKLAVTYSGGTKRKLSLAMALVGDPQVVFLDEPSSGMDPGSRRFMWDLIVGSMRNRSVILTTHSMDEATALCARIGIMVNGQLRCIGSVQHLRHRYGSGYQIDVNVPGEETKIERLQKFIEKHFEDAEMIEQHGGSMKFRVGRKGNNLSGVFRLIEDNKKALEIAEYSVSETTLEQIFNAFAKQQHEDSRDNP